MNYKFFLAFCVSLAMPGSVSIGMNADGVNENIDIAQSTEHRGPIAADSGAEATNPAEPVAKSNALMVWSIVLGSIAGGLSIAGIVIWLIYRHEKQRTEDLAKVATDLGMRFSPQRDDKLLAKLQGFPLFNRGHSRKMKNLMTADTELAKLTLFDYQFTTGGGQTARSHHQTLIAMESDSLQIPQFSIRPEGLLDKVGAKLGFQDIEFHEYPAFSKMFVVQGNDEAAILRFIDAEMIDMLQQRKEVAVDAIPGLFIYGNISRKKPDEISDLMEDGYALYQAFYKRQA